MCGMNLAFNRDLIGPAMYFGLMGEGQPLGRLGCDIQRWHVSIMTLSKSTFCFQVTARSLDASSADMTTCGLDGVLRCASSAYQHISKAIVRGQNVYNLISAVI